MDQGLVKESKGQYLNCIQNKINLTFYLPSALVLACEPGAVGSKCPHLSVSSKIFSSRDSSDKVFYNRILKF